MMPGGLSPQCARWALAGLMALGGAALLVTPAAGAEPKSEVKDSRGDGRTWAERPERSVSVYTEYSQLNVPVGESVRMDLTVENRGRRDEVVAVRLGAVPTGWKAALKGGQFAVTGVPVTPDRPRLLAFTAEPEKSLRPGTYTFEVTAATADNAYVLSQPVVVTVEERKAGPGGDLQIGTSYPVPQDHAISRAGRSDGAAVVVALPERAAARPERPGRRAAPHSAGRDHPHMLRGVVHRLHAAGDPDDLIVRPYPRGPSLDAQQRDTRACSLARDVAYPAGGRDSSLESSAARA